MGEVSRSKTRSYKISPKKKSEVFIPPSLAYLDYTRLTLSVLGKGCAVTLNQVSKTNVKVIADLFKIKF